MRSVFTAGACPDCGGRSFISNLTYEVGGEGSGIWANACRRCSDESGDIVWIVHVEDPSAPGRSRGYQFALVDKSDPLGPLARDNRPVDATPAEDLFLARGVGGSRK